MLWEPFSLKRQKFSFHCLTEPSFLPQLFAPGLYRAEMNLGPNKKGGEPLPSTHIICLSLQCGGINQQPGTGCVCVWCGWRAHGPRFPTAYLCSVHRLAIVSGKITWWYRNNISHSDGTIAWSRPQQSDLILQTLRWALLLHRTSGWQVDGADSTYIVSPGWERDLLG